MASMRCLTEFCTKRRPGTVRAAKAKGHVTEATVADGEGSSRGFRW